MRRLYDWVAGLLGRAAQPRGETEYVTLQITVSLIEEQESTT